jgi:uncharacterized phosphosugar-binding protein
MNAAILYSEKVLHLVKSLEETQAENVERAADICARSISRGGLVFLFGSGHSHALVGEMVPRQGGFVGFYAMVHQAFTAYHDILGPNNLRSVLALESFEGYAENILKGFKFGPHDAMIVISTSGIRSVIIEMAQGAKKRGLPVIGLTSVSHSSACNSGHVSGIKLMDVADVVLDNLAPPGDCILDMEGLDWRTGPVSTITGAMLINMLRCATAERLLQLGHKPVMLPSHQYTSSNMAQAAGEQLEVFYEAYRKSLQHLFT